MAEERGISQKVRFTGAVHDREQMRSMYATADVFAFPSSYDTDGIVLKEAAAFGVPSVVLRDSSVSSMIKDGVNGVTCEATPGSLAAALRRLASDSKLRKALGEKAREGIYRSLEDAARIAYDRYRVTVPS